MKISVVTVCRNAEQTIHRTLRSVQAQSWADVEHILIDGASSDQTLAIIESYRRGSLLLESAPDRGIYDAMNKGIERASGDLVLFLNADDYFISDEVLAACVRQIKKAPQSDIYFGSLLIYDQQQCRGKLWDFGEYRLWKLLRSTLPHPATFFRREFFASYGNFDLDYPIAADFELFLRAAKAGARIVPIDSLVSVFSTGGVSTNPSHKKDMLKERGRAIAVHLDYKERSLFALRWRIKKMFNI